MKVHRVIQLFLINILTIKLVLGSWRISISYLQKTNKKIILVNEVLKFFRKIFLIQITRNLCKRFEELFQQISQKIIKILIFKSHKKIIKNYILFLNYVKILIHFVVIRLYKLISQGIKKRMI